MKPGAGAFLQAKRELVTYGMRADREGRKGRTSQTEVTADGCAQGACLGCSWSGNASGRPREGEPCGEQGGLRACLRS